MLINWKSPALPRLFFLVASGMLLGYFLFVNTQWVPAVLMLAVIFLQLRWLLELLDNPAVSPETWQHIRFDETLGKFTHDGTGELAKTIVHKMNDAILKIRNSRNEKEAEHIFYKNIVMHAGIGLIIYRQTDGRIEILNTAARKLLRINRADNITDLKEISEAMVHAFQRLKTGGRELIRISTGDDFMQLSIYAIELTLRGESLKLISLQNIRNELEEKEMEAWQNLVRVLTHEIMNSVTPISSLASALEQEVSAGKAFDKEQMADMQLSLQTISRRSANLISFVREFRNLTHIPKPRPETLRVKLILEEIQQLFKKELEEKQIQCRVEVQPDDLTVEADKALLEQVLINLVKNATQAFDESADEKHIIMKGFYNERQRPVITITDNGPGIEPEALEKIFIPFFTTRKSGSGIGLSLSRQIMRQHQGTLTARSQPGKGAEFILRF
ncbi:MAG: ATP-binding protein [Cyclobacteriaceae bacterium]|nr:ATP-binding protein [Cyclobacteriaceae bacterium]